MLGALKELYCWPSAEVEPFILASADALFQTALGYAQEPVPLPEELEELLEAGEGLEELEEPAAIEVPDGGAAVVLAEGGAAAGVEAGVEGAGAEDWPGWQAPLAHTLFQSTLS